jgi:hypothetical protein
VIRASVNRIRVIESSVGGGAQSTLAIAKV